MTKIEWDIMTYDEEKIYLKNYKPPNYRYIYYDTFIKIKKKAWKILKENYIKDLAKKPIELKNLARKSIELKNLIIKRTNQI
jgi:hypothetical protein